MHFRFAKVSVLSGLQRANAFPALRASRGEEELSKAGERSRWTSRPLVFVRGGEEGGGQRWGE